MGTDAGVGPHGENLRELSLMAAGGMSGLATSSSTHCLVSLRIAAASGNGTVLARHSSTSLSAIPA